jgi:hypothetical protein
LNFTFKGKRGEREREREGEREREMKTLKFNHLVKNKKF